MKFNKYSEIENHYRKKYIEILRECGFDNEEFISTEKLHGSNLGLYSDGSNLKIASRNQFVDGTFYNCQEVVDRYESIIHDIKNHYFTDSEYIIVYGELFGPGIQSGVDYGSVKDFRAFDIKVDGEYLTPAQTLSICELVELPHVPVIGLYQTLDDALLESNEFISKINPNAGDNNYAEGLVIKPLHSVLRTGNGARVIIKSKHPKFTEKNKRKKRDSKDRVPNPFIPLVEEYVNQNRLDAVLSKFGEPTQKDFGMIIKLMSEDVIKDMIKDDDIPEDYKKHDEYKQVGKAVTTVVAKFLKENLLPEL